MAIVIPKVDRNFFTTYPTTAEDLSAVAADYSVLFVTMWPITITHVGFLVTTTIAADTTAPVISLDRRPTFGSDSGRVELTTMTLADTTAANKMVIKEVGADLNVGEQLVFEHKTQAVDGSSAAGAGHYFILYETKPVLDTSDTNYVAGT